MRQRNVGYVLGKRSQEALDMVLDYWLARLRCPIPHVAYRLGVTYQAAWQIVSRLERYGLVEREWAIGKYRHQSSIWPVG
jgi:DNA-binding IclR family transcriptional regulator